MKRPIRRAPRIGDGKFSFVPNDNDHDGWLLLAPGIRMVGKVQYAELFKVLGYTYGGNEAGTTFGLPQPPVSSCSALIRRTHSRPRAERKP